VCYSATRTSIAHFARCHYCWIFASSQSGSSIIERTIARDCERSLRNADAEGQATSEFRAPLVIISFPDRLYSCQT